MAVTFSSFYGFIFPGVFQVFYKYCLQSSFSLKRPSSSYPSKRDYKQRRPCSCEHKKKETAHALGVQMAGSLWKPKLEAVRSEGSEDKGGAGTGTLSLSSLSFSSLAWNHR